MAQLVDDSAHGRLIPPALRHAAQVGGPRGSRRRPEAVRRVIPVTYTEADRERWVREDPAHKRADRDDFARDRARLVHSASLRRLSAKTQVVQPGDDDFVRNRLTHSLEVAQIGREFGAALGLQRRRRRHRLPRPRPRPPAVRPQRRAGASTPIAAGHRRLRGQRPDAAPADPARGQARRTPTAARPGSTSPGPASTPRRSTRGRRGERSGRHQRSSASTRTTCRVFEWFRDGRPDGRRCLEADVMDWSDDVAYSVHDVEDAIASGRLDLRRLRDAVDVEQVLAVAGGIYAAGPRRRRLGRRAGAAAGHRSGSDRLRRLPG